MYGNIFPSCNRQLHRWFFIEYATPTGRIFVTVRNSQPVTCTETDSETKPLCLDSDWKGHWWCLWHQIINREGDQWRSDYKLWYLARSYWWVLTFQYSRPFTFKFSTFLCKSDESDIYVKIQPIKHWRTLVTNGGAHSGIILQVKNISC